MHRFQFLLHFNFSATRPLNRAAREGLKYLSTFESYIVSNSHLWTRLNRMKRIRNSDNGKDGEQVPLVLNEGELTLVDLIVFSLSLTSLSNSVTGSRQLDSRHFQAEQPGHGRIHGRCHDILAFSFSSCER